MPARPEGAGGPRQRTVVFVSAVTGHGGPNASLRMVLPRLRGVRPVLVGPYDDAEADRWRAAGVQVERIPRPKGGRGLAVATWRLFGVLRRHLKARPLVFANGLTEAAILAPSVALLRLRGLVWVHNYAPPRVALACAPLLRRLARRRLRLAAVSEVASGVGRSVFGSEAEIAPLPNPIEQPTLSSIERAEPAGDRRLRVAYVAGTDRRYKGFDLLPDVIAAADGARLEWLIVAVEATQPEAWRRLRDVMERLEASTVTLRGRTRQMEELYRWADVVLVPSRQESFCRVAAEAMAAGTGVVAARLPAIEEVCGDVAFFFAPEDAEGAADVLRRLSGSRTLLERSSAGGRLRAERFAPAAVVESFQSLLDGVAAGSRA